MTVAEQIARRVHAGQLDKAGQPYVGHLERVVANLMRRWPDATEDEIAAAWLHDVAEDTTVSSQDMFWNGISLKAIGLVIEISRPPIPYLEWISALARTGSLSAVHIKLADLEDNMNPARVAAIPDGPRLVAQRYQPARDLLEQRIAS